MKTNDERVAFPFDSELPGAVRFRIKPSRPGTRKLAATALHPDKPADIDTRSGHLFQPQSSAMLSPANGVKAASSETGPGYKILSSPFPGYLFIAACICIAAAAFGAATGYYIVSFSSPSFMSQTPSPPSRPDSAAQLEPSASERMALKITEMRKIASEESEGAGTPVEDTKTVSTSTLPAASMAHSKDGGAGTLTVPNAASAQQCSAASLALALCGEK